MPYTPPIGAVNLHLAGSYTPPTGTVNLSLGGGGSDDRTLALSARTGGATASIRLASPVRVSVAARTVGARAVCSLAYDPNLLSGVHAVTRSAWAHGLRIGHCAVERGRDSERLTAPGLARWRPAASAPSGRRETWANSARATHGTRPAWREGPGMARGPRDAWRDAPRVDAARRDAWREGPGMARGPRDAWRDLPRLEPGLSAAWRDGAILSAAILGAHGDGLRVVQVHVPRWRDAAYPGTARRPGPQVPPAPAYPWGSHLTLCQALPGAALRLGRGCSNFRVPIRRSYIVRNSAYLVRLPDRTPLPVTSLTIDTDADSWAWSLSATLAGPDAWELIRPVAPGYLPWEVEAGINGHVWRFVLDTPSLGRSFGRSSVTLKGRSLSAWLAAPYTAPSQGTVMDPRTAQQLGEDALDLTGWTLDWELVDWLVPGGLLSYDGTPIERLAQIASAVDGCLYSHPWDRVLYAYPRYPSVAWEWDELTADIAVPESALIAWDQEPDMRPLYNGVYVSGTRAGVLARVVATGTAGDLMAPMVADVLLADSEAIAARARGLAVLSASGPGSTIQADTLLTLATGDGPGLLRPGLLVALAGVKGRVRTTRISAAWSSALVVRQSVSMERREVEA